MDNLIRVSPSRIGPGEVQTVNARELHALLENRDHFATWIKDRIDQYGFVANLDFVTYSENPEKGRPRVEYAISIDMAKELSMVERTEKGRQARQYFIECERRLSSPSRESFQIPQTMSEALRLAANQAEQIESQQKQLAQQAPAVEFAHAIKNTDDAISIGDLGRVLGIGQNRLFKRLRTDHILMESNRPYQHYIDRGYFRLVENVWIDEAREPHITFKTLVTGRGQIYLTAKYGAATESAA